VGKKWRKPIMFQEICVYETKVEQWEEIEQLVKEVKFFYKKQKDALLNHTAKPGMLLIWRK